MLNLKKVIGSIFLITVILVFVYLYLFGNNNQQMVPIIHADTNQTKIRPHEAGGIIIPNADNIVYDNFTNSSSSKKISLLPEPEQPLAINYQKNIDNELIESINAMLANALPSEESSAQSDNFYDRLILNNSDGEVTEDSLSNAQPSKTKKNSLNIIKIPHKDVSRFSESVNLNIGKSSSYQIQLASVRSEAQGIIEGERIKNKFLKILATSNIVLKKVSDNNDNYFYLVLAGSYPSLSKAKAICKKLSFRQQPCMIYQP